MLWIKLTAQCTWSQLITQIQKTKLLSWENSDVVFVYLATVFYPVLVYYYLFSFCLYHPHLNIDAMWEMPL